MLPGIQINFQGGAIGSISTPADGVVGVVANSPTLGLLAFGDNVVLYSLADAENTYGITGTTSPDLHLFLSQLYAKAGRGAEVWVRVAPEATSYDTLMAQELVGLCVAAQGRIRAVFGIMSPGSGYTPVIQDGLDKQVYDAAVTAQNSAKSMTESYYAPVVCFLGAYGFNSTSHTDVVDFRTYEYNRVGIIASPDPRVLGAIAGRFAQTSVQRHLGRKRDGSLTSKWMYAGVPAKDYAYTDLLNTKGLITGRTYVGSAGVYITDDPLAAADDFSYITRRRTIDKAYRLCYTTLIEEMLSEIPVASTGRIQLQLIKAWQQKVAGAIERNMTARGELSADPDTAGDTAVVVYIDPDQNVVATGEIHVNVAVRPFGYAKYITVSLGFQVGQ